MEGKSHASIVTGLGVTSSGDINSAGLDDTLREIDVNNNTFTCVLSMFSSTDYIHTCD